MTTEERKEKQAEFDYCICDLVYALEHVNQKYIRWTVGKTSQEDDPSSDTAKNYCERVFAYELYHQFRKQMCDNVKYNHFFFNGEQQKDNSHFKNLLNVINKEKIIPDLVLHENMGTYEHGGQVLYIEIKTVHNENVYADLKKLSNLTKTTLNFIFYIFVYVDGTIAELQEKVEGPKIKNNYDELDDDILCICVKDQKANRFFVKELKDNIKNKKHEE